MVLLLLRSICNQVFEVENMLVTGSSLWAAGGGVSVQTRNPYTYYTVQTDTLSCREMLRSSLFFQVVCATDVGKPTRRQTSLCLA